MYSNNNPQYILAHEHDLLIIMNNPPPPHCSMTQYLISYKVHYYHILANIITGMGGRGRLDQ